MAPATSRPGQVPARVLRCAGTRTAILTSITFPTKYGSPQFAKLTKGPRSNSWMLQSSSSLQAGRNGETCCTYCARLVLCVA
jgi:hypothetical protein